MGQLMAGLIGSLFVGFLIGFLSGAIASEQSAEARGRKKGRAESLEEWHGFAVINGWAEWVVEPATGRTFFRWKPEVVKDIEAAEQEGKSDG